MERFHDTREARRFSPEGMQKLGLVETGQLFADVYCLEPGQSQRIHRHDGATKLYLVLDGRGTFVVGEERRELAPGGLAAAAAGEPHGIENTSDGRLAVLAVMAPNPNRPEQPPAGEGSRS